MLTFSVVAKRPDFSKPVLSREDLAELQRRLSQMSVTAVQDFYAGSSAAKGPRGPLRKLGSPHRRMIARFQSASARRTILTGRFCGLPGSRPRLTVRRSALPSRQVVNVSLGPPYLTHWTAYSRAGWMRGASQVRGRSKSLCRLGSR
jgi:hypothetical protein